MKIVIVCSHADDQLVRDHFGDDINIVKVENGATTLCYPHVRASKNAVDSITNHVKSAPSGTTLQFTLVSDVYGVNNVEGPGGIRERLLRVEKMLKKLYKRSGHSLWTLRHSTGEFTRIDHGG